MSIRKESDLKKLIDTFGPKLSTGYIEIHNEKANLFSVNENYVSTISKFKEGYLIRDFPYSESGKRTNPLSTQLIDTAHPEYKFAKNLYESSLGISN